MSSSLREGQHTGVCARNWVKFAPRAASPRVKLIAFMLPSMISWSSVSIRKMFGVDDGGGEGRGGSGGGGAGGEGLGPGPGLGPGLGPGARLHFLSALLLLHSGSSFESSLLTQATQAAPPDLHEGQYLSSCFSQPSPFAEASGRRTSKRRGRRAGRLKHEDVRTVILVVVLPCTVHPV